MRSSWWADVVGPVLAGLAEGAWIFVAYLLVETVGGAPIALLAPHFVAVAIGGALAGTWLEGRGEPPWRWIGLASVGLGLIGMLGSPDTVRLLASGNPGGAFGAHPGGWLLGIAAFRGLLGGRTLDDPDRSGLPFAREVLAVAFIWLYAGLLGDPGEAGFGSTAVLPTLVFAISGIASLGLRRVHAISVRAGIAWWRNGPWLAILAVLLVLLAVVAVEVGRGLTSTIPAILSLGGFPEVVVFVIFVAWLILPRRRPGRPRQSTVRGSIGLAILLLIGAAIYRLLHPSATPGPAGAGSAVSAIRTESNGLAGVMIVVAILLGLFVLAIILARQGRRPPAAEPAGPADDQAAFEAERPGLGWLRRARNRFRRDRSSERPASAEAAYLATLRLLEPLPDSRRYPNETPAGHAQRLHREGSGSLELDLLAADYELSRWGARRLPGRETRRAIARWDRSRVRIAARIEAARVAQEEAAERQASKPV